MLAVTTESCSRPNEVIGRVRGLEDGLKNGPDLTKINFTIQYYIAENLGLPAVTDWVAGRTMPGFASHWDFDGKTKLKLALRTDLKWSNGSPITLQEMKQHFQDLHDHLRYHAPSFKDLKSLQLKDNTLTITFLKNVPHVLEELCRADTVLHSGDWKKSSGPYYLEKSDGNQLIMIKNPYFPKELLQGVTPPDKVTLTSEPQEDQVMDFFKKRKLHFSESVGLPSLPPHHLWLEAGAKAYWGADISISSIFMPKEFSMQLRKIVAKAFLTARDRLIPQEHLKPYNQMIPVGYPSYLGLNQEPSLDLKINSKDSNLCKKYSHYPIRIGEVLNRFPTKNSKKFSENLKEALENLQCPFKVEVIAPQQLLKALSEWDKQIKIRGFIGNARDADGSWSFLENAHPPYITDPKTLKLLHKARHTENEEKQKNLFKEVHRSALQSLDIVPLFVSAPAYFHDPDLDLSLINPLDMRMRFWMMEWKKTELWPTMRH